MPIDLGLTRVSALLSRLGNPHLKSNFIHIAGTNGKGSVCAYLSSILIHCTNYKIGKFTSPHLMFRHDCITLNDTTVDQLKFSATESRVMEVNDKYKIGCTEFELLTVTALQIFSDADVDLAIMEVGLGGRLDATNVLVGAIIGKDNVIKSKGVLATGITKIGLDHESILGSTIAEIAGEKAGIIKHGVVNVVDGTNDAEALDVIKRKTIKESSQNFIIPLIDTETIESRFGSIPTSTTPLKGHYQSQNLSISLKIIDLIFPYLETTNLTKSCHFSKSNIIKGIQSVEWPGRLQSLDLKYSHNKPTIPVILDGAHNSQAATELHSYLFDQFPQETPITFIIAITKGKQLDTLLTELQITSRDKIILTKFGSVDGMPWITANEPDELRQEVQKYTSQVIVEKEIAKTFEHVLTDGPVVICGSLYLVGEVLRLHRSM